MKGKTFIAELFILRVKKLSENSIKHDTTKCFRKLRRLKFLSRDEEKNEKHQQGSQTHHAAIVSNEKRSKPTNQNYQKNRTSGRCYFMHQNFYTHEFIFEISL